MIKKTKNLKKITKNTILIEKKNEIVKFEGIGDNIKN